MPQPFRLQSLLDYRRQLEDEQVLALAEATAEERRIREAVTVLGEHREEQTAALAALIAGGTFDAEGYTQRATYLDAVGHALNQQVAALEAAATHIRGRREALVEALKDRRVLERLRDRQADEAAAEDRSREAHDVDDMVMARHRRVT